MKRCLPLIFLAWYAFHAHTYAGVWVNDPTLWSHAVAHAPEKPRPWSNLGASLLMLGDRRGYQALQMAAQLAAQPHIPSYDRDITARTVAANGIQFTEVPR